MKTLHDIGWSAGGGILATGLTGFLSSTPPGLVGAGWYGLPVAWITKRVLAPQYNPWFIQWTGLIVDVIFWSIIAWIILYMWCMMSGKGTKKKKR